MPDSTHKSTTTSVAVTDSDRQPWEAPELTVIDVSQQTQGADVYVGSEAFGYTPS